MSWSERLRTEIALEFRALSEWQRRSFLDVFDHHRARAERVRKHGPAGVRKAYDAARQAAASGANIEAARAAGDMKRVRWLESMKRAKQRKAAKR